MAQKIILMASSPASNEDTVLPKPSLCNAWREAILEHFPDPSVSPFVVVEGRFKDIDPIQLQCDCIVSPANSYGIMGGGFDLELSRSFQGTGDIWRLTDHCQTYIRDNWRGFMPPGSCTIVPLPEDVKGPNKNPWHTTSLAMLPTMHTPEDVSWHKDLVYNAMWTFLVEIQKWNQLRDGAKETASIRTVLMTGLGTGQGGISAKRCAQQMVLAVKHFQQGLPTIIRWEDVRQRNDEIERTMEF